MMTFAKIAKSVAVCAIAAVGGGCAAGPSNPVADRIQITADFANVAGLYEGNDVDVLGLNVGRVDKIEPHGEYVTATMSVNKGTKLPDDVKAALISPSLVTNRHVELYPAYSGKGATLHNGDHLLCGPPCGQSGPERTRTPVDLDRVLQTVDSIAKSLDNNGNPEGPLSGGELAKVLRGNGDKIRDTIGALSSALQLGVNNRDAISQIVKRLNDITRIIATNDQTVRKFSGETTQVTKMLAEQAPGLQAVLTQINDFLNNTSTVLNQNRGQLSGALNRLTGTTQQLRDNARNLTEVVDVAPLVGQNIEDTVNKQGRFIRLRIMVGKSLLDGEVLNQFCQRIQMKSEGCRTGKLEDFGPDFGLTAALLGLSRTK